MLVSNLGEATLRGCVRQGNTSLGEISVSQALGDPGYVQTEVLVKVFLEVGYDGVDLQVFESIDLVVDTLVNGQSDFWANSQYPRDLEWWNIQQRDGSLVGDHLTRLDDPVFSNADGDVEISANNMFLEGDPVARRLLNNFQLEIAAAEEEYLSGDLSQESLDRIADQWIASNRATVDGWLVVAIGVR